MKKLKVSQQRVSETLDGDVPYVLVSSELRIDIAKRSVSVKKHVHRNDEDPWQDLRLEQARLPPTPLTPRPTKLVENERLFWTTVAVLDAYLLKQKGSKSTHVIVSDIVRTLVKMFEYMWIHGFYDPKDFPESCWSNLRNELVAGSWVGALQVEKRAISLLAAKEGEPREYLRTANCRARDRSVRSNFLDRLGTNIAARELQAVRALIVQAEQDSSLAESNDLAKYCRAPQNPMSTTMLKQTLRVLDMLADLPPGLRNRNLPSQSSFSFAEKYGRKGNKTENIDPDTWAKLLSHSYKWIFEYGPGVVEMTRALALHLEPYYDAEMRRCAATNKSSAAYRSISIRKMLRSLPEVHEVEALIGKRVTTYTRRENRRDGTSVYAILDQLYSACFVVIASMNGRRRDEVLGRAIGLHMDSMSILDEKLKISECEFYVEKTAKDYVPYLINDVTRRAIELMREMAEVAWSWSDMVNPNRVRCLSRERKLFILPDLVGAKNGVPLWFEFNANAEKSSESFVFDALGSRRGRPRVAAHMFRRGYGLLYHYRYENGTLLALTQKYGHIDTASTLHYVTDNLNVPYQQTAASRWSAPADVVRRVHKDHVDEMRESIREVGDQKLREYVADVIQGARNFSGGFSKLVARYHRMLGKRISYQSLDAADQGVLLADALIERGHAPYPYPANTCMAGSSRKHAACTSGPGEIAREKASPVVCSGCVYSDTSEAHLAALESDEKHLMEILSRGPKTVSEIKLVHDLDNLRRVISLHKKRLGRSK